MLIDPITALTGALQTSEIIPDVIPPSFQPSILLSVNYGLKNVMLGSEFTKADTAEEPTVSFGPVEDGEPRTYTVAMLDPDAPNRGEPKYGPFRHWVVTGLKPPSVADIEAVAAAASISDTNPLPAKTYNEAVTTYRPPGPGPGTGEHRYVFLLFREPRGGISVPQNAPERGAELEQRRKWSAIEFAKTYGLELVGANYFLLKAD